MIYVTHRELSRLRAPQADVSLSPAVVTGQAMSQTQDRWETHWDAGHNWALVAVPIVSSPSESATRAARLAGLYEELPELDFSRDLLERSRSLLRVLTVPACGWSDLGTPRRVGETVSRYRPAPGACLSMAPGRAAFVDLAARHLQMQAG